MAPESAAHLMLLPRCAEDLMEEVEAVGLRGGGPTGFEGGRLDGVFAGLGPMDGCDEGLGLKDGFWEGRGFREGFGDRERLGVALGV